LEAREAEMSEERLSEQEVALLAAIFQETGYSTHKHVPEHAILQHFRRDIRGLMKKPLRRLHSKGYVSKHPTGGEMTNDISNNKVRNRKTEGTKDHPLTL